MLPFLRRISAHLAPEALALYLMEEQIQILEGCLLVEGPSYLTDHHFGNKLS
jgi:hypothetical protein